MADDYNDKHKKKGREDREGIGMEDRRDGEVFSLLKWSWMRDHKGKKKQTTSISEKNILRKGSSKRKGFGRGGSVWWRGGGGGEYVGVFQEQQIESLLSRTH